MVITFTCFKSKKIRLLKEVINIIIDTKDIENLSIENELEDVLANRKINEELKETLENADLTLKLSLIDENTLGIEKVDVKKDELNNTISYMENNLEDKNNKTENKTKEIEKNNTKETSKFKKIVTSIFNVFEEFFDSIAKKFLKEKFKWNYSVYNDGKNAIKAIKKKDVKTFVEKATDSILYMFKKIPANTKKVIKNTKNAAIKEVFSWNELTG